jgi:hypothetical protein
MFLTSLLLSLKASYYLLAVVAILAFIIMGVSGLLNFGNSRIINLCTLFLLTNAAQMMGWFRFVTGRADTLWTPQR